MDTDLAAGRYMGTILLADISGYTVFLEDVRQEHANDSFADGQIPYAYGLMSSLLVVSLNGSIPPSLSSSSRAMPCSQWARTVWGRRVRRSLGASPAATTTS